MTEHKILFTGTMGAGKTTAIAAISDSPPVSTDVRNLDQSNTKATTTVGLDFAELTLDNGEVLRLYGTPGQQRFDFMWTILAKGAMGLVILIDNSRDKPLDDLDIFLKGFDGLIRSTACVIGVGRTEQHHTPSVDQYADHLGKYGIHAPVIAVDVRVREDVLQLLDLLLLQLDKS